jgi:hypothetical protein
MTNAPHDNPQVFWGEIAPCDHFVQIYDDSGVMLDLLEGFVSGGLRDGDGVVIIATQQHINALDARLLAQGLNLKTLRAEDRYLTYDAADTLAKFMVNDWPDEALFRQTVKETLLRARGNGRHVRAFGEMVAILWANGQSAATVRLEHLWHQFNAEEKFSLFCAYPRVGFTQDAEASIAEICAAHSKVIKG